MRRPRLIARLRRILPGRRASPPARDIGRLDGVHLEYSPDIDGDADPGEVVWTWVPYEEDPSQGKDRPVVVIGRRGNQLIGVPLTSRANEREPQVLVGTGAWDREQRPSYAKLDRLLELDPTQVRREGAVLERPAFERVVNAVQHLHGTPRDYGHGA